MLYREQGKAIEEPAVEEVQVRCPWCATVSAALRATSVTCSSCDALFAVDGAIVHVDDRRVAPATRTRPARPPAEPMSVFAVLVLVTVVAVLVTASFLLG